MQKYLYSSVAVALTLLVIGLAQPSLGESADATSETERLLGTWDCTGSVAGSSSEQDYRRVNGTTLALALDVHTASGTRGAVTETLRYDRASGVWSIDAGKNRFYDAEHLAAPAWAAADWTFSGTETSRGISRPVRIVYSYFPPDSFVRKHQVGSGGHWSADGTFVCRRAPLDARYDGGAVPGGDDALSTAHSPSTRGGSRASATTSKAAQATPKSTGAASTAAATSRPAEPKRKPDVARLAASPAPKVSHTAAPRSPARVALEMKPEAAKAQRQGPDRAYNLTHGVWECKTFGGADATHTYTREADGAIKLHNVLSIANHDYAIDELYRFDRAKEAWTTKTSGDAYAGVAGRWLADTWVFNGDMPVAGHRVPVQMIYSRLGDRAFRRDFVRVQDGARATFAAETCQLR